LNNRFLRNGIVTLILVVGTAALLYMFIFPTDGNKPIAYSGPNGSFLALVADGQVSKVTQRGQVLEIEKTTTDQQTGKPAIVTNYFAHVQDALSNATPVSGPIDAAKSFIREPITGPARTCAPIAS